MFELFLRAFLQNSPTKLRPSNLQPQAFRPLSYSFREAWIPESGIYKLSNSLWEPHRFQEDSMEIPWRCPTPHSLPARASSHLGRTWSLRSKPEGNRFTLVSREMPPGSLGTTSGSSRTLPCSLKHFQEIMRNTSMRPQILMWKLPTSCKSLQATTYDRLRLRIHPVEVYSYCLSTVNSTGP